MALRESTMEHSPTRNIDKKRVPHESPPIGLRGTPQGAAQCPLRAAPPLCPLDFPAQQSRQKTRGSNDLQAPGDCLAVTCCLIHRNVLGC